MPTDLDAVNKSLTAAEWVISKSELTYLPKTPVELSGDARKEVEQFLGDIDDFDDVHRIYPALK